MKRYVHFQKDLIDSIYHSIIFQFTLSLTMQQELKLEKVNQKDGGQRKTCAAEIVEGVLVFNNDT